MTEANTVTLSRSRLHRIYFGWRIVAAMFITTMLVYGNLFYSFIILSAPLAQEFGWSATQSGSLVSAMWIVAPLALFLAPIIHRFGALPTIIAGLALQSICLAMLSQVSSFEQLYALRVVMGVGKVVTIVAVPVMVTSWFSKRFGTAMALAWCGGSFGGFVMSPATEMILTQMPWREASLVIAGIMSVSTLLVYVMCRGPKVPADLGLDLDGDEIAAVSRQPGDTDKPSFSELRSINYVTAGLMACALLLSGVGAIAMLNQAPTFIEAAGVSSAAAASLLGVMAVCSSLGQIAVGWIEASRVFRRRFHLSHATILRVSLAA